MTVTTAGIHDIAAGSMMDVGDVTFTCPAGGHGCSVEVMENADDGTITVTSTGCMATAMPSQMAIDRVASVSLTEVPKEVTDTLKAGTYTVPPGTTVNDSSGNVAFTCPANGIACTVTVDEDGGVLSTGGKATAMTSEEYTAKIAQAKLDAAAAKIKTDKALVLADLLFADDDDSIVGATITRELGDDPEIKLDGGDGAALTPTAPLYEEAGSAPNALGWHGQMQTRDLTDGKVEHVTIYTDIKAPTDLMLSEYYVDTDNRMTDGIDTFSNDQVLTFNTMVTDKHEAKLFSANEFPVAPPTGFSAFTYGTDVEGENPVDFDHDSKFDGTFRGISGEYSCNSGANCKAEVSAAEKMVLTGTWTFTPEDDKAMLRGVAQDPDYLYFGYWVQTLDAPDDYSGFSTFVGGNAEFGPGETPLDGVVGTATYRGQAGGKYVEKQFDSDGIVTNADIGRFTAMAVLKANFGANDDVSTGDDFEINGTITNFKDAGNDPLGFEVALGAIDLNRDGAMKQTSTFAGGRTTMPGSSLRGEWEGQFFGPRDPVEGVQNVFEKPTGVAGTFDAKSSNADITGAFGATKR